jgi:hypothetical protein
VTSHHGGAELAYGRCHALVFAHDGVDTSVHCIFVGFDHGVGHLGDSE